MEGLHPGLKVGGGPWRAVSRAEPWVCNNTETWFMPGTRFQPAKATHFPGGRGLDGCRLGGGFGGVAGAMRSGRAKLRDAAFYGVVLRALIDESRMCVCIMIVVLNLLLCIDY